MLKNIFDSHAHYNDSRFDEDRDKVLTALPEQGVRGVISCGDTLESSAVSQSLAEKYNYIYFTAGIHPHNAKDATSEMEDTLKEFAKHEKMVAIGEIGLDYYYDHSPRDVQIDVFRRQINLANQLDLPVVVHNRDAHQDTYDILSELKPKGVVHSYSGSIEMAERFLELGYYFGFTGVVTFKNARRPLEVVEFLPADRILVETDCPYLAPVPFRGKRSDSSMITATITKMAEIKGMEPQELLDITFDNTCRLFNIDPKSL